MMLSGRHSQSDQLLNPKYRAALDSGCTSHTVMESSFSYLVVTNGNKTLFQFLSWTVWATRLRFVVVYEFDIRHMFGSHDCYAW